MYFMCVYVGTTVQVARAQLIAETNVAVSLHAKNSDATAPWW